MEDTKNILLLHFLLSTVPLVLNTIEGSHCLVHIVGVFLHHALYVEE